MYITGDTHGDLSISKLNSENFPENKFLTKNNYVIITGDFGLVWNNKSDELYWRKWLKEKNFTTLFIDGNHENHNMLDNFPIQEWNGGKVHFINDSIVHLMRGQVFNIEGKKIFTFGGADSIDKMYRIENISWWAREVPSYKEYEEGLVNLEKHNWEVDYIITHTCSNQTFDKLNKYLNLYKYPTSISDYFDIIEKKVKYKQWYFGHFHDYISIDDKHTLLYNKVKLI